MMMSLSVGMLKINTVRNGTKKKEKKKKKKIYVQVIVLEV